MLNREAFLDLIKEKFSNNYSECANALKVNVSTISRIVNGKSDVGSKFLKNLISYCHSNGLDFNKYIFFNQTIA